MGWTSGDTVLYRYGHLGEPRFVNTCRVLADDADGLALWIAPGSPQIESVLPDGRHLRSLPLAQRFEAQRVRRPTRWRGPGIVRLVPPDAEWSIWWFYAAEGGFEGWYGNLESPQVRWEADGLRGVDSADRALDVWILPDGTSSWKDEDEFAILTGRPGWWTAEQVPAIRAAGEHLRRLAAAGAAPFDGRFTDFRPDPSWPAPVLPEGWDRPHLATP
ncbi:DUF402 domain-containing protein [Plantactinospora sp. KBS50]|uniref:DUF402 domain-containing protein n=1 Tax=Plantactinospora sp. KBS50 TaxID=2024580 RepID=UPI000BAA9D10|nr:DUF402 domain-containing protein [Plantactinospora sp. KBS50]ASW54472.1 hypothetical protein CIK06_10160 [Plantactinospora sp. KBS50]